MGCINSRIKVFLSCFRKGRGGGFLGRSDKKGEDTRTLDV